MLARLGVKKKPASCPCIDASREIYPPPKATLNHWSSRSSPLSHSFFPPSSWRTCWTQLHSWLYCWLWCSVEILQKPWFSGWSPKWIIPATCGSGSILGLSGTSPNWIQIAARSRLDFPCKLLKRGKSGKTKIVVTLSHIHEDNFDVLPAESLGPFNKTLQCITSHLSESILWFIEPVTELAWATHINLCSKIFSL